MYQSQVRPLAPPARRIRRHWRRVLGVLVLIALGASLLRQATGAGGAAAADVLRAVLGPSATARIEADYLGALDTLQAIEYRLGGQSTRAPWAVAPTAMARTPTRPATPAPPALASRPNQGAALAPRTSQVPVPARPPLRPAPMALASIPVVVAPALPAEGVWITAGLPGAGPGALPPLAKTFLRPDPARPWALATILQVDLRVARLHIVAGVSEPGGPVGHAGSGLIPPTDTQGGRLLAVFNGGFKYADGAYGLMSDATVYARPVWGAATIAVTRSGGVIMGSWGLDRRLQETNRALTAWRQNAGLLIDHGRITAQTQDGAGWGLTILNSAYTWRSGVGLTKRGTLLYAAGNALSAATLAETLRAAGAVTAMQLDINPYWVRAFTYGRDGQGGLVAWALDPAMPGNGMEYMYGDPRDFFYLTRRGG